MEKLPKIKITTKESRTKLQGKIFIGQIFPSLKILR